MGLLPSKLMAVNSGAWLLNILSNFPEGNDLMQDYLFYSFHEYT